MSESSDQNWLILIISILIAFKQEIKKTYTEMKSWSKTKLKEFWGHTVAVMIGFIAICTAIFISLDASPDYVMIFSNLEALFIPAISNTVLFGLGIAGIWFVCDNTKCCIRVVKYGDCTNFCP